MALFKRKNQQPSKGEVSSEVEEEQGTKLDKFMRRPGNTAFKQQRLKAWQPILTPKTVLPTFFVIGILFAPIGGLLLWGSNQVKEFTIDYTQCEFDASSDANTIPDSKWSYHMGDSSSVSPPTWSFTTDDSANATRSRICTVTFDVPVRMEAPVFMYYKLTNYYQNHRRYVQSLDGDQLKGKAQSYHTIKGGDCEPLDVTDGKPYYPCGLIANSVFNDSYTQPVLLNPSGGASNQTYNMTEKGIAWPGEGEKYQQTQYQADEVAVPPFWVETYPGGYTNSGLPNIHNDEHFWVWMRTAGLPTFRKLWQRNPDEDMEAGTYSIDIFMNYPVADFSGTKSIVFSTVSWIGGRNPFLGIAYIVVAGICVLIGLALTLRHLIKPRKLGDMTYLSWNQQ